MHKDDIHFLIVFVYFLTCVAIFIAQYEEIKKNNEILEIELEINRSLKEKIEAQNEND